MFFRVDEEKLLFVGGRMRGPADFVIAAHVEFFVTGRGEVPPLWFVNLMKAHKLAMFVFDEGCRAAEAEFQSAGRPRLSMIGLTCRTHLWFTPTCGSIDYISNWTPLATRRQPSQSIDEESTP